METPLNNTRNSLIELDGKIEGPGIYTTDKLPDGNFATVIVYTPEDEEYHKYFESFLRFIETVNPGSIMVAVNELETFFFEEYDVLSNYQFELQKLKKLLCELTDHRIEALLRLNLEKLNLLADLDNKTEALQEYVDRQMKKEGLL